jgi:alpha-mannosidase
MRLRSAIICFVWLALATLPVAASPPEMIWQLGTFDRSSAEFADGSPGQPVSFVANRDQPEKTWYAYAPAVSTSGKLDPASESRTIQFSIDGKVSPAYRLTVSLLIERSSVPALRIIINGRTGMFYLHPTLDYSMGDTMAAFFPAYSHALVEFCFSGDYLRVGANTVALQAVAETNNNVPDAGFNYDAIKLESARSPQIKPSLRIEPTIFYRTQGASLAEQVDVFVRYGQRPRSGLVDLEVAGHHYTNSLQADQDFGEEQFHFAVPEFAANSPAHVTVRLNRDEAHFTQTLQPKKKWTLFLVPHVHLDVGYTDYQAKVSAIQSRILDEAMDLTAEHPSFRFSTDGEWNLEQYFKTRTAQEKQLSRRLFSMSRFTYQRSPAIC